MGVCIARGGRCFRNLLPGRHGSQTARSLPWCPPKLTISSSRIPIVLTTWVVRTINATDTAGRVGEEASRVHIACEFTCML
jgi:hypothetical protein